MGKKASAAINAVTIAADNLRKAAADLQGVLDGWSHLNREFTDEVCAQIANMPDPSRHPLCKRAEQWADLATARSSTLSKAIEESWKARAGLNALIKAKGDKTRKQSLPSCKQAYDYYTKAEVAATYILSHYRTTNWIRGGPWIDHW
jgi:hypothetical protein